MINKTVIRKWVDALRSGDYEQTTGLLGGVGKDGQISYCCLGVLCEVAIADGLTIDRELSDAPNYSPYVRELKIGESRSMPPAEVAEYIGLVAPFPGDEFDPWTIPLSAAPERFREENEYGETVLQAVESDDGPRLGLADMNDSAEATFDEIATAVENAYLKDEK